MINSKQKRHLLLLYRSAMVFFVLNFSTIFAFAQVSRYFGQIPVGNSDTNGFVRIDKVFCDSPRGWKKCGIIFQIFDRSAYGTKIHGGLLDNTVF